MGGEDSADAGGLVSAESGATADLAAEGLDADARGLGDGGEIEQRLECLDAGQCGIDGGEGFAVLMTRMISAAAALTALTAFSGVSPCATQ